MVPNREVVQQLRFGRVPLQHWQKPALNLAG